MEQLLDLVFGYADDAHKQHLASESFAEHMALGDFYDGVREAVDAFVEAGTGLDLPPIPASETPIIDKLENSYVALKDMRDGVCHQDTTLENLFDAITGCYATALYKLKRLR